MVGYKLSKNDWVTPFFVIFRSVREKLLVTVFFEHPVVAEFYEPLLNVFCCNDFSFWYGKWGGPTKKTTFCKNGQLGSELPAPIAKLCWCWNILRKAATLIFLCLVLFWSSHHYDQHEASVRSTVCQDDMFGRWKLLIILHFLQTNGLTTDVIV